MCITPEVADDLGRFQMTPQRRDDSDWTAEERPRSPASPRRLGRDRALAVITEAKGGVEVWVRPSKGREVLRALDE